MKRNVLALGLGFLTLVVLSLTLMVQWPAVSTGEAATSLGAEVVPTPTPWPDGRLIKIGTEAEAAYTLSSEDALAEADAEEQLLIELYERVSPSVVHIAVTTASGGGTGSGFVWDAEGHIVTNNHVVENARRILVAFADDTTVEAELVGADADSDLAVIRVDVPAALLKPAELGDSATLRVGQRAVAIGNPFGLEQTMTTGIVSALGRVVQQDSGFSLPQLIQTDAAINPGNSGGPLLDSQGQVIGVTTLIYSQSGSNSGVGFAVPVNTVKRVVPSLIEIGRYADPWLGITGTSVTPLLAEALDLPVERGVLVQAVVRGGPADKAGLQGGNRQVRYEGMAFAVGGDIIAAIDGLEVQDMDDVIVYLAGASVGQKVELTILRDGQKQTIVVTLEERPTN